MKAKGTKNITYTQRLQLEAYLIAGFNKKEIATKLGVCLATVYNELKRGEYTRKCYTYTDCFGDRHYKAKISYSPNIAEDKYRINMTAHGAPLKIANDYEFVHYMEKRVLKDKLSPCAVLGEIKRKNLFKTKISKTTLYRYIEMGIFYHIRISDLPMYRRKLRYRKTVAKRSPKGTSIEKRPIDILNRSSFGHWEMDCVPISIGASGEMNLRAEDSKKLLLKLVGTEECLSQTVLTQYFRAVLMTKVKSYLAQTVKSQKINVFAIDEKLQELSTSLNEMLRSDFEEYGVTLEKFFVTTIVKPDGDPQYEKFKSLYFRQYADIAEAKLRQQVGIIDEETKARQTIIESQAIAAKRAQEGYTYQQERGFDVAEGFANNEGSGQFANMGVGLGMMAGVGGTMANVVGGAVNGVLNGSPQNSGACDTYCEQCGTKLVDGSAFCEECGNSVAKANDVCVKCGYKFERQGKFCPKCGNKR